MTSGEKLQLLRKEHNLSQEQLSQKLNVSRQAISKWELDQSLPDTENLIKLSKLFDVSVDYLLDYNINNQQSQKQAIKNTSDLLNNDLVIKQVSKTNGEVIYNDNVISLIQDINKIDINFVSGNVDVSMYDGNDIKIIYKDEIDVECNCYIEKNILKIISKIKNGWSFFKSITNKQKQGDLTVFIPKSLISNYNVHTVSGNISATLTCDILKLDTVSGDIEAKIHANNASFSSVSGDNTVDFNGDNLTLKSVSGDITANSTANIINAKVISGDISLDVNEEKAENIVATSVSGDCVIWLDNLNYTVNFSSLSGSFKDNATKSTVIKPTTVYFKSTSGDLTINNKLKK